MVRQGVEAMNQLCIRLPGEQLFLVLGYFLSTVYGLTRGQVRSANPNGGNPYPGGEATTKFSPY